MSTVSTSVVKGIPIVNYNNVISEKAGQVEFEGKLYNGFYVSYNNHDANIYGDVTTALVLGQMQKFFILNGNHTEEYKKIIDCGFLKCMEYFKNHIERINKFSDK